MLVGDALKLHVVIDADVCNALSLASRQRLRQYVSMSVGTCWIIATDDVADAILSGEDDDLPTLWLDGIGEIEWIALGEQLGAPYDPTPVVEAADGGIVLRLPEGFLRAMAALPQDSGVATAARWRAAAEGLAPRDDLAAVLTDMSAFARSALEGPGILSVPMF